jgi:hypothetical protein
MLISKLTDLLALQTKANKKQTCCTPQSQVEGARIDDVVGAEVVEDS